MLTSRGSDTRVLSEWELKERNRIMKRPDNFSDAEIADHDLTGETRGRKYDPLSYEINTSPIDQQDHSRRVDRRKILPEVGD